MLSIPEIKLGSHNRHLASKSSNTRFNPNIGQLKAASVLLASIALVACGGGGSTTAATATTALTSIDGVWRVCLDNGTDSQQFVLNLKSGTASFQITDHVGSTTCSNTPTATKTGINTVDYTFGSTVTVDGTASGITTATKINFVEGGIIPGEEATLEPFELVAIKGNELFLGDTDGANDGTTEALRPTQLGSLPATKQVALTSVNGDWSACGNTGASSSVQVNQTLTDGSGSSVQSVFDNADCTQPPITIGTTQTFTYELGSQVTVNGREEGVTNATQYTLTDTTVGSTSIGESEFDLVAISGTKLFFGDTNTSPSGTTSENRATQLQDITFNKN
jgi:hypothetical protein